ncbi:uncharacterized protein BDZ99DRAFT_462992 [Mytilinidion resinicola]|uniref:DUF7730 domain-containing protein n=1 Tax=Mytilinidion resinicola TaxID=574789 RepID=A0A6A6YRA2_9PEZI|nr:uncharacterized protein BDZ99DRAFT_462992 [Mytilinidion resinicola]KAF2810417.1 hypothetical protein BDZ99DRAFT_462992 [Mytilinidion resinicola]
MMATPKKKRTGFLDLPGELRNQSYYYCFHPGNDLSLATAKTQLRPKPIKSIKLCVTSTLGSKDRIFRTHCDQETLDSDDHTLNGTTKARGQTLTQSRLMGKYFRIHGTHTNWKTSVHALLLVNKQIHTEIIPLFYAATTIRTASPTRLSNFFTNTPPGAAAWVRKLELTYTTYGNAHRADLAHFRAKHVARWTELCRQAAKLMLGLESLRVWVHVTASPLHLDLRQDWVAPLLQFRRLTTPPNAARKNEAGGHGTQNPLLTHIKVELSSAFTHPFKWAHPGPETACFELHRLFGEAIGRAMRGWSERDAMAEWDEAWEETYAEWQHFLKFKVMY